MSSFFIVLVAVVLMGVATFDWGQLGSAPSPQDVKRLAVSKNYEENNARFVNNPRYANLSSQRQRASSWKIMNDWFTPGENRVPQTILPEIAPDLEAFVDTSVDFSVIWFGHSTFLVNLRGTILLVDPVFSNAASPVSLFVKRFQRPVVPLSELPAIDYVLISHDHYDHLDKASVAFFADKATQFITPLGVGSHLRGWGIKDENIVEKDWWQSETLGDITFTATPANHFSGRKGTDANATLWASWVISDAHTRLYFSGDSGYGTHFEAIGNRYGPFDMAFIESGQYNENWPDVHMFPEEGVKAFHALKAERYFPVHWGMFELSLHEWNAPVSELYAMSQAQGFTLVTPKIGETVRLDRPVNNPTWWREEITPIH